MLRYWLPVLATALPALDAADSTPRKLLAEYSAEAGAPATTERGRKCTAAGIAAEKADLLSC